MVVPPAGAAVDAGGGRGTGAALGVRPRARDIGAIDLYHGPKVSGTWSTGHRSVVADHRVPLRPHRPLRGSP
ncbi:hypothetical protein CZ771_00325 [Actinomycetales bacterium JB111]|nr:hypothetical protein CZ771_00325 [Actinomycetales bacterium JB111]